MKPRTLVVAALIVAGLIVVPAAFVRNSLDQPSTVQGVVVGVKARPPLAVDSFELLVPDGRRLTFTIGQLDMSPGGFDAPHLVSHQATGQPVVVSYRSQGGGFVAVRLQDGGFPAGPSGSAEPSAASGAVGAR